MSERFTGRLQRVLAQARREALARSDPEISPGHLLVALATVRVGRVHAALRSAGLTPRAARNAFDRIAPPVGDVQPEAVPPYADESNVALARAEALADEFTESEIDTPYLLIALLEDPKGVPARLVAHLGIQRENLRSEGFHVLQLKGTLSYWEFPKHMEDLCMEPRACDFHEQLDTLARLHNDAFLAKNWETSARLAGTLYELLLAAGACNFYEWQEVAKEKLDAVLARYARGS